MASFTDSKGVVWTIFYDPPSFAQIHPWQGYGIRYPSEPRLFAFTETGLHDDINAYAATHAPKSSSTPTEPTVTYKELVDARGVRWLLRTDSLPTTAGRWRGYVQTDQYGLPKPDFTAPSEAFLRAQIASYVVGHPVKTAPKPKPVPSPKPGSPGGGTVSPVVMPAAPKPKAAAPVVALAALAAFGALLLSRRG